MAFSVTPFMTELDRDWAKAQNELDAANTQIGLNLAADVLQAQGIKDAGILNALGLKSQALGLNAQAAALQGQANQLSLSATGTRQISTLAGDAEMNATLNNINLLNYRTATNLDTMARQAKSLLSTQVAQAAGTGLAVGSKSFMAIAGETIDENNRAMAYAMQDTFNQKVGMLYQTGVNTAINAAKSELEATTAEYGSTISNFQAGLANTQATYVGDQANFVEQSAFNQYTSLSNLAQTKAAKQRELAQARASQATVGTWYIQ